MKRLLGAIVCMMLVAFSFPNTINAQSPETEKSGFYDELPVVMPVNAPTPRDFDASLCGYQESWNVPEGVLGVCSEKDNLGIMRVIFVKQNEAVALLTISQQDEGSVENAVCEIWVHKAVQSALSKTPDHQAVNRLMENPEGEFLHTTARCRESLGMFIVGGQAVVKISQVYSP